METTDPTATQICHHYPTHLDGAHNYPSLISERCGLIFLACYQRWRAASVLGSGEDWHSVNTPDDRAAQQETPRLMVSPQYSSVCETWVYVSTHTHTHTHTHAHTHTHTHTHTCTHTHAYTHKHTHTQIYRHTERTDVVRGEGW